VLACSGLLSSVSVGRDCFSCFPVAFFLIGDLVDLFWTLDFVRRLLLVKFLIIGFSLVDGSFESGFLTHSVLSFVVLGRKSYRFILFEFFAAGPLERSESLCVEP
jgi:hypothetical protein